MTGYTAHTRGPEDQGEQEAADGGRALAACATCLATRNGGRESRPGRCNINQTPRSRKSTDTEVPVEYGERPYSIRSCEVHAVGGCSSCLQHHLSSLKDSLIFSFPGETLFSPSVVSCGLAALLVQPGLPYCTVRFEDTCRPASRDEGAGLSQAELPWLSTSASTSLQKTAVSQTTFNL